MEASFYRFKNNHLSLETVLVSGYSNWGSYYAVTDTATRLSGTGELFLLYRSIFILAEVLWVVDIGFIVGFKKILRTLSYTSDPTTLSC